MDRLIERELKCYGGNNIFSWMNCVTVSVLAAEKDDALCCVVVEKAVGKSVWKKTVMHIRGTNECRCSLICNDTVKEVHDRATLVGGKSGCNED